MLLIRRTAAHSLLFAVFACSPVLAADNTTTNSSPEALPSIALPEEQPSSPSGHSDVELNPMTVVATGNARIVSEVPQKVEILNRDEIERSQSTDLAELLDRVPGVELLGGPRPDAQNLVIRGLGGLSGTRVMLLVDGAHQNLDRGVLSRLNVDPALLKSVEVLKGPASMLYGSGAIAGVVSLTTKDANDLLPEDRDWGLRLRSGYHSADEGWEAGGSAFTAIGPLDLLVDAQWRDTDDFRQGGGSYMPYSARESHSNLAKVGWNLNDGSTLKLSSTGFSADGLSLSNPTQPVSDENSLRYREQDQRFSALAYETEPDIGAWNHLRIALDHADYQTFEQEIPGDSDAGSLSAISTGDSGIPLDSVVMLIDEILAAAGDIYPSAEDSEQEPPRHYDLTTVGGDITSGFGLDLWQQQITIGGEYHVDDGKARQGGQPINNFPDAEQTTYGIYVQNEFRPWSFVNVVAGLRYDRYQSRPAEQIDAEDVDEDAISRQIGATVALGRGFSMAALYGEAFRAPSLRESYSFGQHFMGNEFMINPDLKPEEARNKELSLRYRGRPFGLDSLSASITAFQTDIKNFMEMIVTVEVEGPVPPAFQCIALNPPVGCVNRDNPVAPPIFIGGTTTTVNLPRARIRGFEADTALRYNWFELSASYSRIRGDDQETGEPLSMIPADNASLVVAGHFDQVRLELSVQASDNQDRVPAPQEDRAAISEPTPGYTVYGAGLYWEPQSRWLHGATLRLAVENFTDKRYRNHLTFDHSHYQIGRNVKASIVLPL